MADSDKKVRITLVKSPIGAKSNHRDCVRGLGLKRMHQSAEVADTPANRGMMNQIRHLLKVG